MFKDNLPLGASGLVGACVGVGTLNIFLGMAAFVFTLYLDLLRLKLEATFLDEVKRYWEMELKR